MSMMSEIPEGLKDVRALQDGGFTDSEINDHVNQVRATLQQGGFTDREADQYFGVTPFDEKPIQQHFDTALTNMVDSWKPAPPSSQEGAPLAAPPTEIPAREGATSKMRVASESDGVISGLSQAFEAGFGTSVTGLLKHGAMPDIKTSDDASWYMRVANQLGMTMGDLPPAFAAGIATSLAAGPAAPLVAPVTTAVALGAATNALPTALREFLMQKYQKGEVTDFRDFWSRTSSIFLKTLQSAAIGGATLGVGGAVGGVAGVKALEGGAKVIAKPLLNTTAKLASEIGTMVTLGKAFEGQVPKPADFSDAAIVVAMLGGVQKAVGPRGVPVASEFEVDDIRGMSVQKKLQDIYAKTGINPSEVALQAEKDPVLRQQLLQKSVDIPEAYKKFVDPSAEETTTSVKMDKSFDDGTLVTRKETGLSPLDTTKDSVRRILGSEEGSIGLGEKPPEVVRTEDEKAVLSRIGEAPKEGFAVNWHALYTKFIDRRHPIGVWKDVVTEGGEVPAGADPYIIARLLPGNSGRAEHFVRFGAVDYKNPLKPVEGSLGLKQILEPLGNDLDGYRAYALAKSAVGRSARDLKTGIDLEAAKRVVDSGAAKYEPVTKQVVEWRRSLFNYMRDSGILTEDQISNWEKSDPHYTVPLYRILEDGPGGSSKGKGLTVRNPIMRAKGSELKIVDPVESLVKDAYTFVEMAERNRLLRAVVDMGKKYGAPAELLEKVETPIKPIDVTPEEMAKFQDEFGIGGESAGQSLTIFRAMKQELKPEEIGPMYDGKRQTWRVPIEFAEALKDMDAPQASRLIRIIATPVRLLKAGTTMLPEFMVKNTFRDQLTRFVFSDKNTVPYFGIFEAIGEQINGGETYKQWLRSGGASASLMSINQDYIQNNLLRLKPMTSIREKVFNTVSSPVRVAEMFGELAENATRISEFKRSVEGKPVKRSTAFQAAYNSREVTLDFQRIGASMQAANQVVQFLNAQVQGIDRVAREGRDNPRGLLIKGGVLAAATFTLWAANYGDPYIDEIPQWQKDLFWLVHVPNWQQISSAEGTKLGRFARQRPDGTWEKNVGTIFRIPKPQELGLLFATSVERMLDGLIKHDPKAMEGFVKTVLSATTPPMIPATVGPALETFNNKSMFTEASIVPGHLEKLLPEAQYTEYTSESAKLLGKIIPDVKFGSNYLSSPMVIENWVRGWGGGGGMYAIQTADAALAKLGIAVPPPKAEWTLADMPIIKAFVARFPSANMRSITDFREKYQEHQTYLATIQHYANTGNAEAARKLLTIEANKSKLISLDSTQKGIDNLKRTIELVDANKNYEASQKRQLIDGMYMQMANLAWYGNKMVKDMEEKLNKK